MNNVISIKPRVPSINAPAALADRPIWLIWRLEAKPDNPDKLLKVPYYAKGGKRSGVQGRPEDRAQLVDFKTAIAAAEKRNFTGVGLSLLDGDITGLDFDNCVIDGKLLPEVEAMVAGTYAEYSPSGTGVHAFVLGNMTGNNKSIATREQFGLEAFSTKGFLTFTGKPLEITELTGCEDVIAEASKELTSLVRLRFGDPADAFDYTAGSQEPLGVSPEVIQEALDVLDNEMHYDHWLMVGMAIHHETNGEGFEIWDEWSRKSSKYSTPEYGQARWDSFGRNPNRQITIRSLIQLANQSGARISVGAVSMDEFEDLTAGEVVEFDHLDDLPAVVEKLKARFQAVSWREFSVQLSFAYLIKGLLPKAALGVLYGESGSGKSFLALDMAFAIARGIPWRGLRTKQHKVVYLAAEGASGFRNRLAAYALHNDLKDQDIPLQIIDAAPNFLLKDDALDICKAALADAGRPGLIVIDTFAQVLAGANENASEDMGKALAHCKGIHKATGALVLLVHHSGKDASRGARGWSGLRAAADVELEVSRSGDNRALRTTKQKDGADFQEWGFKLKSVMLGQDEDGDPINSCVIEESLIIRRPKSQRIGPNEQLILSAMGELELTKGQSVDRDALLDHALSEFTFEDLKDESEIRKTRRQTRKNLSRAIDQLTEKHMLYIPLDGKVEFYDDGVTVS